MGRSRRCRSIVMSTSVVALGATGACPAANAASGPASGPHGERAGIARKHVNPRRRHHSPKPVGPQGAYVYEAAIEAEVNANEANARCVTGTMKLIGVGLSPEGPNESYTRPPTVARNSNDLWDQNPAAWEGPHTITTGPGTTLTMQWTPPAERREAEEESQRNNGEVRDPRLMGQEDTGLASTVCAATTPDAGVLSIGKGLATWRLSRAVTSLHALLSQPVTSIVASEYVAGGLEILPNGSVPPFAHELESPTREEERAKAEPSKAD